MIRKVFVWILGVAICSTVSGCATLKRFNEHGLLSNKEIEKKEALKKINTSDGINQEEATILGQFYYFRYVLEEPEKVSMEGATPAKAEGDQWVVYASLCSQLNGKILIDMKSGKMSSTFNKTPTLDDPTEAIEPGWTCGTFMPLPSEKTLTKELPQEGGK